MKLEIEKVKDGTFTSRGIGKNGKLIFANHDANTKQAAYKNLIADAKGWANLFGLTGADVSKVKNNPKLLITHSYGAKAIIDVKEINC